MIRDVLALAVSAVAVIGLFLFWLAVVALKLGILVGACWLIWLGIGHLSGGAA